MMKHYRKLLLLPMLVGLAACDSDPTPSVLVDSDKVSIEVRNIDGLCNSLWDKNALEISLFEGYNDLQLSGDDQLALLVDGLPLDIVELKGGQSSILSERNYYCYFVDLTDAGLDAYTLSDHLVELEYSRGTEQSYINTLVFPDVEIDFSNSSASVQPFIAQLLVDDTLASPEFYSGHIKLESVESGEYSPLCLYFGFIGADDINAEEIMELNLNYSPLSCEIGTHTYTASDDSEIGFIYKSSMNNVDGLESLTIFAKSTISWPFDNFTYTKN